MQTWVTVERVRLKFSAAHMAVFRGDVEPLHGHNYAVIVECHGPLTEDGWVVDFGHIKSAMRLLCDELDHKFLLQRSSTVFGAVERDGAWEVAAAGRRYVFPSTDVLALPVDNSTAEQIARYLHGRLCTALLEQSISTIESITIGVEEAPGQTGWFRAPFRA